jgi:O-methyltransferase
MTTRSRPPVTDLDPAELYLDLIKHCLTRVGFEEELAPVVATRRNVQRAWAAVERVLARGSLVVRRRPPARPQEQEEGRIWPGTAETMVGLRRLDNVQACIEQVIADGVRGDILEAGVWRGGTSIFARAVLAAHGVHDRTVWVADSFQGLPKPAPGDDLDTGDTLWTHPQLAVSLAEVQANFARYGLLDSQVRFLEGWFADTLPGAPIDQLAVLRADGDLYRSTLDVLEPLYPKLAVGGFLIIDDFALPACKAAVNEYRERHSITEPIQEIDWTGAFWRRER